MQPSVNVSFIAALFCGLSDEMKCKSTLELPYPSKARRTRWLLLRAIGACWSSAKPIGGGDIRFAASACCPQDAGAGVAPLRHARAAVHPGAAVWCCRGAFLRLIDKYPGACQWPPHEGNGNAPPCCSRAQQNFSLPPLPYATDALVPVIDNQVGRCPSHQVPAPVLRRLCLTSTRIIALSLWPPKTWKVAHLPCLFHAQTMRPCSPLHQIC